MDVTGKCLNNSRCPFKHPPGTTHTLKRAASAVSSHDQHASDIADIKTMLYAIIKEQTEQKATITEQKALFTAFLAETAEE